MDIAESCWYLANQPTGLVTVGLKYSFALTILSDMGIFQQLRVPADPYETVFVVQSPTLIGGRKVHYFKNDSVVEV